MIPPLRAWVLPALVAALVTALVGAGAWGPLGVPPRGTSDGDDFEARLARGGVEVVVLGSSMAGSHIDAPRLGAGLGLPEEAVAKYPMPHGASTHWYAAFRRRLDGSASPPRRVFVVGSLGQMLQADVFPGLDEAIYLGELRPDPDADLLEPLGGGPLALRRAVLRVHLATVIEDGLAQARHTAARLAGRPEDEARRFRGGAFDAVIPELRDPGDGPRPDLPVSITMFQQVVPFEASALPRLIDGLRSTGAEVVVVRAPTRPDLRAIDNFSPAFAAEVGAAVEARGAQWVDLHDPPMSPGLFEDPVHLGPEGAALFTDRLLAALADGGS